MRRADTLVVCPASDSLNCSSSCVIALIVLGPKKLPEAGRAMGKGMREFKDSLSGITDDDEKPAIKS